MSVVSKEKIALEYLKYIHQIGEISTQQYRSVKGMLKCISKSGQRGGRHFVLNLMCRLYPTDKDRFYFHSEFGGWSSVENLY